MLLSNYWRAVRRLPPRLGVNYILSKIVFGVGIGIAVAAHFNLGKIIGLILIIAGILVMIPAEIVLAKEMANIIREERKRNNAHNLYKRQVSR
ncbi:hypothetical protein KW787_02260 [Candidatus Pacearchaeota archaeon]|nr:hypothetical protein [Candidatus Pacearchaeota archaeon]